MFKMRSVRDLYDHIAYVILYAPDRFPFRDFLGDDGQMNLDRAFEQLREGVLVAYPDEFHPERRAPLISILDMSFAAYRSGDTSEGAKLLQDFQNAVFKSE